LWTLFDPAQGTPSDPIAEYGMECAQPDALAEIERLKSLAAWYRDWADLAGSEHERQGRLGLAAGIEAKAAALAAASRREG
jgi:hypothetical protein